MSTLNTSLHQSRQVQSMQTGRYFSVIAASAREMLALLSATVLAATIVVISVGVAGMEITDVLGAAIWGVAFIFFGLAVDSSDIKAVLQLVTGLALLSLAWLQANVSADFIIVSGVIAAAWAAVSVFQRLR